MKTFNTKKQLAEMQKQLAQIQKEQQNRLAKETEKQRKMLAQIKW